MSWRKSVQLTKKRVGLFSVLALALLILIGWNWRGSLAEQKSLSRTTQVIAEFLGSVPAKMWQPMPSPRRGNTASFVTIEQLRRGEDATGEPDKGYSPGKPIDAAVKTVRSPTTPAQLATRTVTKQRHEPAENSGIKTIQREHSDSSPEEESVQLRSELAGLETSYERISFRIFQRFGADAVTASPNPFGQALQEATGQTTVAGGRTDVSAAPGPSGSGDGGSIADPAQSSPGSTPEPVSEGGPQPGPRFNFLITGNFGDGSGTVQRAVRNDDGSFDLENETTLSLIPMLVGIPREQILLGDGDQLVTGDISGNGQLDYVRTREQFLGTVIECYESTGSRFELIASTFLLYRSVRSMALFPTPEGNRSQLALLLHGSSHLFFFNIEIETGEINYEREVTLPYEPSLLAVESVERPSGPQQRLHIFNSILSEARYLISTSNSRLFRFADPESFETETIRLDSSEGAQAIEVGILTMQGRLMLFRSSEGGLLRQVSSLLTIPSVPLVVLGEHREPGEWRLAYLP